MSYLQSVRINPDTAASDAFSRLRVSQPEAVFDSSFEYSLSPLLWEATATGTGAAVTHDATNRCATLTFADTPTANQVRMQTYAYHRYQPGRSHLVFVTFNLLGGVAGVTKYVGYSDADNGVELQLTGSELSWNLKSNTDKGDLKVVQADWNMDRLDGTGPSGVTLDVTKTHIAVISLQWLGVGRVQVGFDLGGVVVYCHEFLHANLETVPYMQSANLPVRAGMTSAGTVSASMRLICASVISEGGQHELRGFTFQQEFAVTAASGARTLVGQLRPAATFNSITNRTQLVIEELDALVTGNNPVLIELCLGQAVTGASFSPVGTYSTAEFSTAGTLSGSPAIVASAIYVAASAQAKGSAAENQHSRYPITLDAAGAARDLGTITILATGLGGSSACRVNLGWRGVR